MIHTDNNTNFKQIATSNAVLDSHYLDIISNIQGTSKTGYDFNDVVTASIQYLTYNSFYRLNDNEYTLTHFKGILDTINIREQFGYKPMIETPYNGNLEYKQVFYLREAYAIIQLAYYMNCNNLENTDFFKYTKHYSITGEKLPDDLYNDDLSYLHKEYSKIDNNGKDRYKHAITKHFNGCLLILLNDLKLPTTHFNKSVKDNREYNAMVQSPRDWRTIFPFELLEFDIKSAFPTFIDYLIGSNIGSNVYELIMQTYNVERSDAKILYNTWINSTKYKNAQQFTEFFEPIYKEYTPKLVAYLTDKTTLFWQRLFELENRSIDLFKYNNNVHNGTRLHDAYFIINNEYYNPITYTDFGLATFGKKLSEPTQLEITCNTSKNISKGYEPAINKHLDMNMISSEYFNQNIDFVNVGKFTIYQRHFECYKSNFNVSVNGMYSDGEFIFYTDKWFIDKIQNLTNVLFHLNQDKREHQILTYLELILAHIKAKGVWSFNTQLLINHLLENRTEPTIQYTDYIYHSDITIRNVYDFQSEYYDAIRKANLVFQCKSVFHIVEHSYKTKTKLFINIKDIFENKNYKNRNELFVQMIEDFNKANGFSNLFNALIIKDLHTKRHETHNPIINTTNSVVNNMSFLDKRTIQRQNKTYKDWLKHTQHIDTIQSIYNQMHQLITDASLIKVVEKSIEIDTNENPIFEQQFSTPNKSYKEQWNDAFGNEAPDMTKSVLCVSHSDAQKQTDDFYRSWLLFKFNPTDTQRTLLLENAYRLKTNQITIIELLMPSFPKLKHNLKVA